MSSNECWGDHDQMSSGTASACRRDRHNHRTDGSASLRHLLGRSVSHGSLDAFYEGDQVTVGPTPISNVPCTGASTGYRTCVLILRLHDMEIVGDADTGE